MLRLLRCCAALLLAAQLPQASRSFRVRRAAPRMALASQGLRHTVDLDLGERSYPIYIGEDVMGAEAGLLQQHMAQKVLVITNDKVGPLYLDACVKSAAAGGAEVHTLVLPDGEKYKEMDTIMKVMDKALELKLDRRSLFVALGGGVIGDMVGFAAAIYQRGVRFVQVPTTLMAMVDSSVGGKTGVNHPDGKNMIGAFMQPQCVLIDTQSLASLPDRELASGIAEIIKYGLIFDAELFVWLEKNMDRLLAREPDALAHAVRRSCEIKADIVAQDEREGGVRATLNLGHTFGHAVELGLGYGAWLHGEAVGLGMAMAADLSLAEGWITQELRDRAIKLIEAAKLPTALPEGHGLTPAGFRESMSRDKKVKDGQLFLILLEGELGNCVISDQWDNAKMEEVLATYCA